MKETILFLCMHNTARSPMAEHYAKRFLGAEYDCYSAGVLPHDMCPYAVRVMREDGFDLSAFTPTSPDQLPVSTFQHVVTTCPLVKKRLPLTLKGVHLIHRTFPDPGTAQGTEDEILAQYRHLRDEIKAFVRDELPGLLKT